MATRLRRHTPADHPVSVGYSHAVEASGRLLFVSGQTPKRPDGGPVADDPRDQLRQTWANLENVLRTAGAALEDLVHVRVYLSDREHRQALRDVRDEVLGDLEPALTVVICGIWDEAWVTEIEAVAALAEDPA